MTILEIKKRIKEIEKVKGDEEYAHILEDELREDFIKYISKTGTSEQRKMAREILKIEDMDFGRWYD